MSGAVDKKIIETREELDNSHLLIYLREQGSLILLL